MKIVSTNIGKPTAVIKNGKEVKTGIYKTSVESAITLGLTDVVGDAVMDRRFHGGIDKACYIYSADKYDFWKEQFPDLHWTWGMFGENLTVSGYDDNEVFIGDAYKIGTAIIQVSEPRRPCSILGIRFGTQKMVKLFNNSSFPGTYVRIIQEGEVKTGDEFELIERVSEISVSEVFNLFSSEKNNNELAKKALNTDSLAQDTKESIVKRFTL